MKQPVQPWQCSAPSMEQLQPPSFAAHCSGGCTADQLWPHVNQALCTMCRAELEPVLKDQKPSWIASISLSRWALCFLLYSVTAFVSRLVFCLVALWMPLYS